MTNVNTTLGEICRYYYPGVVEVRGVAKAATSWSHWGLGQRSDPDSPQDAPVLRNCQALVWDEFWVSFDIIFVLKHALS